MPTVLGRFVPEHGSRILTFHLTVHAISETIAYKHRFSGTSSSTMSRKRSLRMFAAAEGRLGRTFLARFRK